MLLVGGILAGAVGVQLRHQFEASITAATARDRVTNLFGQHVSPAVVERLMIEGADAGSDLRACRRDVRRFPQFYRGGAGPDARRKSWSASTALSPCWWKFSTAMAAS